MENLYIVIFLYSDMYVEKSFNQIRLAQNLLQLNEELDPKTFPQNFTVCP